MTATNHALTGALIGLAVANPVVALPMAFASHFVLDAVPHYGGSHNPLHWMRSRLFKSLLVVDVCFCIGLVLILSSARPAHWLVAALCAFVATSPDLFWVKQFLTAVRRNHFVPGKALFLRFHDFVQWFQRPIGWVVECAWFAGAVVLLLGFLHTRT